MKWARRGKLAVALRTARRKDVDVVLLGELREATELKLALRLACSGRLVFAALGATSAIAAIRQNFAGFSTDAEPEVRGLLAESLAVIVAEQLIPAAEGRGTWA